MTDGMPNMDFYRGRKVLLTGHTGFKGTWLSKILVNAGADVLGYSLGTKKDPSFFEMSGVESQLTHVCGDIRDFEHLQQVFQEFQPEVVFHLAAQPIVRESYIDPRYTFDTNVMGTVNVLECIRLTKSVKSAVIVTTDKVYRNDERTEGYREDDVLDGFDPYSNSKSCAELAVASYRRSFFDAAGIPVSTARAGNVIGGGDFAKDRIIPDCVRAVAAGEPVAVRNPNSVRPFQHVLEPLHAYLLIAERQWEEPILADSYNIGPEDDDCVITADLAQLFCEKWGDGVTWLARNEVDAPHETGLLKLSCTLMVSTFGWCSRWNIDQAIDATCRFSKLWLTGGNIPAEMDAEIAEYER